MLLLAGSIEIAALRVGEPVDGGKLAEELADLLLLKFFAAVILAGFGISRTTGREDHVVDEFGYALAVLIVEYFADHALQEGLILKLELLVVFVAGLLTVPASSIIIALKLPLLRLRTDEAVQVGQGSVEL